MELASLHTDLNEVRTMSHLNQDFSTDTRHFLGGNFLFLDLAPADDEDPAPARKRRKLEWKQGHEDVRRPLDQSVLLQEKMKSAVREYIYIYIPDLRLFFRSDAYSAAGWVQIRQCSKCERCDLRYKFSHDPAGGAAQTSLFVHGGNQRPKLWPTAGAPPTCVSTGRPAN